MNAIINVEILLLIHKTFCQYAPNIQYQYVYPYTQGAYYKRYGNNEYGLNRDKRKRKRKQYLGYDINIQLDNDQKRLKCKCSKKHCKNKQKKTDEGSCCQNPNKYTGNYYQYDNKDCNGYQIGTNTPYNLYKPFRFIAAPHIMFKPGKLEYFLNYFLFTTTVKSTESTSIKNPDGGINDLVEPELPEYVRTTVDSVEENESESEETTTTRQTTHKDTQSTGVHVTTKKLLLFKDSSIKRLCPQRKCYKKIGKYYVNDIIARPTLGNRRKRYLDANNISPRPNKITAKQNK